MGTDGAGNKFAVKIVEKQQANIDLKFLELLNSEVKTLQSIKHPKIVNLLDYSEHGKIVSSLTGTNTEKEVIFMALELVPNGELFDYVSVTGKFSENMTRLFFLELLEVLNFLHTSNICHRDIKPENLMLDTNYQLKVLDFGFSILASGRDGSGLLKTYLGTPLYMAPEIHNGELYDGKSVDLFAAGVLLFILLSGNPPFRAATLYDPLYKLIASKNYVVFWNFHSKSKPIGFYSDDFKALINGMLASEPTERLNMEAIISSPWCKGPTATEEDRKVEFQMRNNLIKDKAKKNAEEEKKFAQGGAKGAFRGLGDQNIDVEQLEVEEDAPLKKCFKFDDTMLNDVTSFLTTTNPNVVMFMLKSAIIVQKPVSLDADAEIYKMRANLKGDISDVSLKVKIYERSKGVYFVEIKKQKV